MNANGSQTWTVGHDGSADAAHAVRWAVAHAEGRGVELCLVRSWQVQSLEVAMVGGSIDQFAPTDVSDDFELIRSDALDVGVPIDSKVVHGSPSIVLLDESAKGELLVVGSRGLGGFRRLLLGSVSSQCAAHTSVPMIVVPASASIRAPLRRIVVGVDGSERSQHALSWACEFAPDDCEIIVAGAWMLSRSGFAAVAQHYTDELEQARAGFNEVVDAAEGLLGAERFSRHFAFKDPAEALLDLSIDADLVVVGQRGHSGLSLALLGSVSTHVLHHSRVPVAIIPMVD